MSYSAYAFTNMAQLDSSFRSEAAHYTQLAIQKMLTGSIAQAFRNPNAAIGPTPSFRCSTSATST